MNKKMSKFSGIFKALSNVNRLKVFEIIRAGRSVKSSCRRESRPEDIPCDAVCVCEILNQMKITAPTLSHHLKELRNAGLVDVYHRGQWSYYTIRKELVDELAEYFTELV